MIMCIFCSDQAIKLANSTDYGLGCSIWTVNVGQAHRVANKVLLLLASFFAVSFLVFG